MTKPKQLTKPEALSTEPKPEESDIWSDPELMELLFQSEENRESIVATKREAGEPEPDPKEIPNSQDPQQAHELYYGTLEPLLRKYLAFAGEDARKKIREQKCLLLKDGHTSGRDGRQSYLSRIQQAITIISQWERFCAANIIPPKETRVHRLFVMFQAAVNDLPIKSA